jgi:hypothetical protein
MSHLQVLIPSDPSTSLEEPTLYANIGPRGLVNSPTPTRRSFDSQATPPATRATLATWRQDEPNIDPNMEPNIDPNIDPNMEPLPDLVYSVDVLHWHCTLTLSVACPPVSASLLQGLEPYTQTLPRLSFFALGKANAPRMLFPSLFPSL